MLRRVIILEQLFNDIATPQEREIVNELYAKRLKGNAVKFMLSKVKAQWDIMMGKTDSPEAPQSPRTIVITENGVSRHVARAQLRG